ncbi:MAG: sugar phosphate nucleotidyltransferase, partial [Planctomycetota bacterium]|nr:sugar phosphate nucleotidyltransferase [Planctomycetota bacterium]
MLYAVIMAGGSGTRFWPRSRKSRPKHHIAIAGDKTMIQQTLERLEGEVPLERTLVVTIGEQVAMTREQLPELPPENIIAEPQARNTAAAVGLGAIHVKARSEDTDATMLVVTADHVIQPKSE